MAKHFMTERVQIGLESTRGTAVTTTLEVPFVGEGLVVTQTSHLGEIRGSAHFPSRTEMVNVGVSHGLSIAWELNKNNIRDFILLGTKRTGGVLPSVTLIHDQAGVAPALYKGCVVERLRLGFSRSGSPGAEAVLAGVMDLQCFSGENDAGVIQSLTAAHANRFQMRHSSINVSSTAVPIALSTELVIANNLGLGPHLGGSSDREYIIDGDETPELRISKAFFEETMRMLVESQSEVTGNSIVFATGAVNETVTATMGKLRAASRSRGQAEGAPTEDVTLEPYHTGAAHQVVWSFGSAIGVSVLGL